MNKVCIKAERDLPMTLTKCCESLNATIKKFINTDGQVGCIGKFSISTTTCQYIVNILSLLGHEFGEDSHVKT